MKFRDRVQGFGRNLSAMVMPNIGAFIAWGFITAFFIPTGWTPNESLSSMVGPMITYMLPLLIAYTGGKMVGGVRGGVVGAVAAMGVVVGTSIPMFIGAMIMGPLGGVCIKYFDKLVEGKIKAGFEMIVNNFSAGLIGMGLAILGYLVIGPVVETVSNWLGSGVEVIVEAKLLPLASIFIEPAKVLFLNNAINHGVLGPLGIAQAADAGKSILFLLETNPGPGLGILAAYWVFGKGMAKNSAPGAIIIHFLGGIHEIYFPYILMKPVLLLAVIAGGASGVLTFSIFNVGLVATPSPGSIFALMAMTPKGNFVGVLAGVIVAAVVAFLVASIFLRGSKASDEDLEDAKEKMVGLKGKESSVVKTRADVKKIVVACDAGMGSSALGATLLKKKLAQYGVNIEVSNTDIQSIPSDADLVITQETLTPLAKEKAPNARHMSITNFVETGAYEKLVIEIADSDEVVEVAETVVKAPSTILLEKNVVVGLESVDKWEAIEKSGQSLLDSGYVQKEYIPAMAEREKLTSVYIGNHLAIPHGIGKAAEFINSSGLVVHQYPEGVDFGNGNIAYIVIGIAGKGNEHLNILGQIAKVFSDEDKVLEIAKTKSSKEIYDTLTEFIEV